MILRYMGRNFFQEGSQRMRGINDQAPKSDYTISSFKDSGCKSTSSKQMRGLSGDLIADSSVKAAKTSEDDKIKQAEESLRTVMYLSCWGPG